jgi:predicted nucleic acid-binding protein
MRVVLDTNILVIRFDFSCRPSRCYLRCMGDGKFTLLTCAEHLDELRATLQKPRIAELIKPHRAGRLVNQIKELAEEISSLPV